MYCDIIQWLGCKVKISSEDRVGTIKRDTEIGDTNALLPSIITSYEFSYQTAQNETGSMWNMPLAHEVKKIIYDLKVRTWLY